MKGGKKEYSLHPSIHSLFQLEEMDRMLMEDLLKNTKDTEEGRMKIEELMKLPLNCLQLIHPY